MHVVLLDPSQQVPAYDRALAAALAELGDRVTLATAPLLYYDIRPPPGVAVALSFGRLLGARASGPLEPASTDPHRVDPSGPEARAPRSRSFLIRHATARRLLRAAGFPWELAAFLREMGQVRPAVVHVQWSLAPYLDAPALSSLRRKGIATVLTAHNVLPHEPRPWHVRQYRRLYRSVDRLIVHSAAARDRLIALGGIDAARVRIIPIPAHSALPSAPSPLDRAAARGALDLPLDLPLVLFFGHVRPYKGLDLLLAAWPRVASRLPQARLVVAGPVAGGGHAVRRLQSDIDTLGISASVLLRPGYVPEPAVAACFEAANLVVLPYRAVDDSAVLAHARGHGRAVVATAVGGLPEALAAGGGRLVPSADPIALAEALAEVLGNPDLRARLESEARAAAAAWTWRDAAIATRDVYDEAAAASSRQAGR